MFDHYKENIGGVQRGGEGDCLVLSKADEPMKSLPLCNWAECRCRFKTNENERNVYVCMHIPTTEFASTLDSVTRAKWGRDSGWMELNGVPNGRENVDCDDFCILTVLSPAHSLRQFYRELAGPVPGRAYLS